MNANLFVEGGGSRSGAAREMRGSALVMAVFVLVLLTSMGAGLLFLSQHEARMSQAGLRAKKAFYLSEAAIEDGRTTLYGINSEGEFDAALVASAGADGNLDFDPATLEVAYDADGNVTGFTGFGDDVPLRAVTPLGGPGDAGWYAAFLTNDPIDGIDNQTDSNMRVMVTGIGAGANRSVEVVQAILAPFRYVPSVPSAALTLVGDNPHFANGNSAAQEYSGNDCGIPGGPFAPIVGGIGSDAKAAIVAGLEGDPDSDFTSGPMPYTGAGTIGDLSDPTDPIVADAGHGTVDEMFSDCESLKSMVELLQLTADYYCNADLDSCTFPATTPDSVVFIDGDLSNTPAGAYSGILVVTGELTYNGNTGWNGLIVVVGEGRLVRTGGGNQNPSGSVIVAEIDPTPDGPAVDKSDWCTIPPDGIGNAYYDASGAGNSNVEWCTAFIAAANPIHSYAVKEFLQR